VREILLRSSWLWYFARMSSSDSSRLSPQFETIEYAATPGNCVLCNQPIAGQYYRVNGAQACSACVHRERTAQGTSAAHYPRALLFGIGAAIVGMIGYAAFEIATGWIIGYVSLAVGWLVGKAMLKGSNGFGGRRYQVTAALLTYAAVSMAAVPVIIHQVSQHKHNQTQVRPQGVPSQSVVPGQSSAPTPDSHPSLTVTPSPESKPERPVAAVPEKPKPRMGAGKALGLLALVGLASPFLELSDPLHGIIGLVILFVGMQIAWKMTGRPKLIIDGPF
jgi:hypothetical protein